MIDKEQVQSEMEKSLEKVEISLLLEAIYLHYGYDFRDYSRAHIKRRINHRKTISGLQTITRIQEKVLYDRDFFNQLLMDFSINVTEMFRDPEFYQFLRNRVVSRLKTYPFVKVWVAGCSSGEEVYSMAILFKEEGIYDRVQIYATDFNENVLAKAKEGIYPVKVMKRYSENYSRSGGVKDFSDYYIAKYDSAMMSGELKENIVFADHNLVTDGAFGEMNMVVCRNVLIYFTRDLQKRVVELFAESLAPGGFLCLGSKESITFIDSRRRFNDFEVNYNTFQRKYE